MSRTCALLRLRIVFCLCSLNVAWDSGNNSHSPTTFILKCEVDVRRLHGRSNFVSSQFFVCNPISQIRKKLLRREIAVVASREITFDGRIEFVT